MTIDIKPVADKSMLKQFVKVPWHVYRDDPAWVPPLIVERLDAFSPNDPFFEHAQWQAWVAYVDGQPAGRISAQIDQLHLARYHDASGYFGLLEGDDDVELFRALTATAERWLSERGMHRVVGPFNLGINQEVGLLYDGYETSPYFLMGHARPYYHDHLQTLGFEPCKEMLAYELPTVYDEPRTVTRLRARLAKQIRLRTLERTDKAAELEVLRNIFNDAWSANWGFVPFTATEFKAIGDMLMLVLPKDFVWIAELDGEAVGFIVMLPNLNEAIKDLNGRLLPFGWVKLLWRLKIRFTKTARVPLMGVRRNLQETMVGAGVAMSLIYAVREAARKRGVVTNELSWILEDNAGMRNILERIGGVISKRYRMYEKQLS